jgi:alkylation response protein AidB-like acyl-CoA dehydrogenase
MPVPPVTDERPPDAGSTAPAASERAGETQAAKAAAIRLAEEVVRPGAEAWERAGRIPAHVFIRAAEAGLCRLLVPRRLGGLELGARGTAEVMEVLAGSCFATAFSLVVHNNLAATLARHGSEALIERFLPDLLAGRRIGAFLLTEPQGGSDAAAITSSARPEAAGYRLDGEKAWVSNGAFADLLSVYVQTDPAAGWRGIACFLVDADAPGVRRRAPYALLRGHALGTSGFGFEACRVDADRRLLGPGAAFKAALAGIDLARVNVAAMCCGMLADALESALAHARERRAFGRAVLEFQGIEWMLADAATDIEAARLLTYAAADRLDAGEPATLAAAHAKKFATRAAFSRLGELMQIMGAQGLAAEHSLARHLAAAKMTHFLDGTTEIQNVVIARHLVQAGLDRTGVDA